ncbi:MAG: hypothetical protein JJU33_07720 [Phycisphaerales bacterium]|nr:hypothetical protein [Phycisphaerales bacterium]
MADAAAQAEQQQPKKSPKLVLIVVAALMLIEGVAVVVVMKLTSGGRDAHANIVGKDEADAESFAEVQLLAGRFQNMTTGRVWDWEVELHLKVRNKNMDRVRRTLDNRSAEIRAGIATIIRRAPHTQLKEPERRSITRQVHALMDEVLGLDPLGESYIGEVLVPVLDGYPADF